MSITNKKLDAIRRLILGPYYDECKNNPMGVKREELEKHFKELKNEGCIHDKCDFDELIKVCKLKSHYPTCLSDNRECIENYGEKQTGVNKFYYNEYKKAKLIEDDESDDSDDDEIECPICTLNEDENGIKLVEHPLNQEEQGPLSCGHLVHKSCLIKEAVTRALDKAVCPLCNKVFELSEVSVPVRNTLVRDRDELRRNVFNATQMNKTFEEIADALSTTVEGLLESMEMTPEEASEYFTIPLQDITRHVSQVNRRLEFGEEVMLRSDSDDEEEYMSENIEVSTLILGGDYRQATRYADRYNSEYGPGDWVKLPVLEALISAFKNTTDKRQLETILELSNSIIGIYSEFNYDSELTELFIYMFNGHRNQKYTAKLLLASLSDRSQARIEGILRNCLLKGYDSIIKFIFEHYDRKQANYTEYMNFNPPPNDMLKEILDRLLEEINFSRINSSTIDIIREWYADHYYENMML